ncbi:hypothetical protein WQ57_21395 [Mesobacillus campisalis]|uniref:Uncharacterized protein n=1 Tax=Mesobacillus campisalis TaxID=1408103 RepID=A0A0M2SSX4_9BACI|nr:hypothetical protein [Mesobacillus campisalis]KKK36077.1 hypothetical protein WQ57_21395 [Mesobacillus campisalis]
MTILNYLGCNFILPYSEGDSDNKILIMESISGDEALASVKKHFTTKYVYQLFAPWGSGIWFNKHYRNEYPKSNTESQESFLSLCHLLDANLQAGDYCELYICWAGEEGEDRNMELDQIINLNAFDINKIQIYEKTLLVIQK